MSVSREDDRRGGVAEGGRGRGIMEEAECDTQTTRRACKKGENTAKSLKSTRADSPTNRLDISTVKVEQAD